jgi:predicted dehydrogenase
MKKQKKNSKQDSKITRRDFLGSAAAITATFTIVPSHVLGSTGRPPANERLNIAAIGIGGMGKRNIRNCVTENIVALCDVDDKHAGPIFDLYPSAAKYRDYRKMFDKQKNIDAVIIATPDHTHAVIAMEAMRRGKHLFCQKPLTHSIYEARMLTNAARKYKVVTQMGNQGHSGEGIRLIKEWIDDGAIGQVRQVHVWTTRSAVKWSKGINRPTDNPPIPSSLDWDLWLGPAPERPYHPCYHPVRWRGWWDFGTGALGDMGCHLMDPPLWALKLSHPISVEAVSTKINDETAPSVCVVRYDFPARGAMLPVKLTWYDGDLKLPIPEELEIGRRMGDRNGGVLFVGDKGKLMCGCYGKSPRLIPEAKMKEYKKPPKTIDRIPDGLSGHEKDWIRACKGGKPASSNFDCAGPLTETVLLGNIAIRSGKKIYWDAKNMKVANVPEANKYVNPPYRQGWKL